MLDILSATVPIFLVVGLGFVTTRLGMFERSDMSVLARYVVKLALPVLIFVNVAGRSLGEILNPTYLLAYAVAAMVMVALGLAWAAARGVRGSVRAATIAFAMSGTNNGFVGFPTFLIVIPAFAGLAVGMDMLVDNTLIIPVALALFEAVSGAATSWARRLRDIVVRVVTHPMVIAIILALLMDPLGIALPPMIDRSVNLVAQSSSAVALFSIGGMLVGLRLRGQLADLAVAVGGKLLVMPAVMLGLVLALPLLGLPDLPPELKVAAVLTGALPSMSIVAAVAEQHGDGEFGAASMMLSTAVSFLTMTGWLLAMAGFGWL